MHIGNVEDIKKVHVKASGAINAFKQVLINVDHGWEGWAMRLFTLGPGGQTPRHAHPWPHINYIIAGRGILYMDGKQHNVKEGSVAYIPDEIDHQFINDGEKEFSFICIVPEIGES